MSLQIGYTIHDVKALAYYPPFFCQNDAIAKRMTSELANDVGTSLGRHPSDFKLYKICSYDDATGIVQPLTVMEHVCDVVALVSRPAAGLFDVPPPETGHAHRPRTNGAV